MNKIQVLNSEGKSISEISLNEEVFGQKPNDKLIAQAVAIQLSNARNPIAHTKTRGEVSGGGRKPWKQKGTGRARAGSTRSPLWTGGGVTFGPRNVRNFEKQFPKKMRRISLMIALSDKVNQDRLLIAEDLQFSKVSTKEAIQFFGKFSINGKVLVILPKENPNFEMSVANLDFVKILRLENINVLDILNHNYILTTSDGVKALEEQFVGKDK